MTAAASPAQNVEWSMPLLLVTAAFSLMLANAIDLTDIAIRQPRAPDIETSDLVPCSEGLQPVAPDRALPVAFNMREPATDAQQRRAAAGHRISDAYAVAGGTEANLLVHDAKCKPVLLYE